MNLLSWFWALVWFLRSLADPFPKNTLPDDRRPAYVTGVSNAAAPDATLLLYGFRQPPKAAPMHAGMTVDEVQQRFGTAGWELVNAERSHIKPIMASKADDLFELWRYQLRCTST